MSEHGFRGHHGLPLMTESALSQDGRWTMVLGVVALLFGFGASAAGAYVGFGASGRLITLPAGLPAAEPETVALFMFACGAVTMLLGAISIYKAYEV